MKRKIATLIAGILLVGIVTAGLVPWLSNIVSGSVTVEGPVFYLDGQIGNGVYHKLLVNEIPKEEIEINWSDGERIVFKTEPLNINEFYKANFEIHIWAKTNNESGNLLQINIIKINEDKKEEIICSNLTLITAPSKKTHKEISCNSKEKIMMNPGDRLGLEIKGLETSMSDTFWISTGKKYTKGYSRIEVSAA